MTGTWKWYRESGTLWQVGTFDDDKKSGPWKRYHANGKLYDAGIFIDNEKAGLWKVYDSSRSLRNTKTYRSKISR